MLTVPGAVLYNCLVLLDVSPVLHNCSSRVTKTRALPADSALQSSGNNCWIKQRGKKLPGGPPKQTGVLEAKTGSRRTLLRNNEQKLLVYVEQKPESSRNSPSCFRIQSIFSLAHMEWASANFLPQTFLFPTTLRQKQDRQFNGSHSYLKAAAWRNSLTIQFSWLNKLLQISPATNTPKCTPLAHSKSKLTST